MLALSISPWEMRYISWESTESDIELKSSQVIPWEQPVDGFTRVSAITSLIQQVAAETGNSNNEPAFISLDSSFCHFSILEIDPSWDLAQQTAFQRENRFGDRPLYQSFNYLLAPGTGRYLTIECPAGLRQGIMSALPQFNDGNVHQMSLGIFSAFNYAQRVVPGLERGIRLFWRVDEFGDDQILEVNDGEFVALHFVSFGDHRVRQISTVGDSILRDPLGSFLNNLLAGHEAAFPEIEGIFVYQGSGSSEFLESLVESRHSQISLMNPFWRWNWPAIPGADTRLTQSAFVELAEAIWMQSDVAG